MVFIHSTLNSAPMLDSKNHRLTGWLAENDRCSCGTVPKTGPPRRRGEQGQGLCEASGRDSPSLPAPSGGRQDARAGGLMVPLCASVRTRS